MRGAARPPGIHANSSGRQRLQAYFNLGWREAHLTPAESVAANPNELAGDRAERLSLQRQQAMYLAELSDDAPLVALAAGPASAAAAPAQPRRQDPQWASRYSPQQWMHTAVVHTRKRGFKKQFVCFRKVVLPNGATTWVKGGAQLVDGHWKLLKNAVTRSGTNTAHRARLHEQVRSHQWRFWTQGKCRFTALGAVFRQMRERGVRVDVRSTPFFRAAQAQRRKAAAARRCARRDSPEAARTPSPPPAARPRPSQAPRPAAPTQPVPAASPIAVGGIRPSAAPARSAGPQRIPGGSRHADLLPPRRPVQPAPADFLEQCFAGARGRCRRHGQ